MLANGHHCGASLSAGLRPMIWQHVHETTMHWLLADLGIVLRKSMPVIRREGLRAAVSFCAGACTNSSSRRQRPCTLCARAMLACLQLPNTDALWFCLS